MTAPLSSRASSGRGALAPELSSAGPPSTAILPADRWDLDRLLELKRETVSVVLPAREVAETIATVVAALAPLERAGLVDELVVVDAASGDGTAEIAARAGAAVVQESEVLAEFGPALGKGDAMWRGLAATDGEIVVYIDTDTRDFDARFLLGLLGPLLERPGTDFVKGAFRRPFVVEGAAPVPDGGGRVTELVARPLLNLFAPALAGFAQPLAGETAARRGLLESIPFPVGYGVEIALIIDVAERVGVEAMAQVDLGTRQNRHQPLRDLSAMAYAVLATATRRFHGDAAVEAAPGAGLLALPGPEGTELRRVPLEERPPLGTLTAEARGGSGVRAAARR
jgi:glucosyl-3-phosphoglycerate synthase